MSSIPALGGSPGGGHAAHSSALAWRTPRTEEPGGLVHGATGVGRDGAGTLSIQAVLILKPTLQWGGHGADGSPRRPGGAQVVLLAVLHDSSAASPGPSPCVGCPAPSPPTSRPQQWASSGAVPQGGTSKAFSTQEVRQECPSGLGRSLGNMLETTFPALLVFLQDS